jgi:hypothetical protein
MKFRIGMKKILITIIIVTLFTLPAIPQKKTQETVIKREVTLYNPYKPSLSDALKKSYLPDMTDTSNVKSVFKYDLQPEPFMPSYTISPIKPATLLPDPLSKLYNSYLRLGLGNYLSPLAEISIANERSKKGAIGILARHFSTNSNIQLQNGNPAFAGYMDNDASLFGKRFLQNSIFSGSVDFSQKSRHAYGYDPSFLNWDPPKNATRLSYLNAGATIGLTSAKLDSSSLAYNFGLSYDFFNNIRSIYQHRVRFTGLMAKSFKGFYMGSGFEYDHYSFSDSAYASPRYIATISPFVKKSSSEWSVKLGFQALLERGTGESVQLHFYPDLHFGFNIVPAYVGFFADLSGKLVKNDPLNVIGINPFIFPDSTLFRFNNTDHALIVKGGLTGSTGIDGNYQISVAYSIVNNMLFFENFINTTISDSPQKGNYFIPLYDDVQVLNIHGETGGKITDLLSFNAEANYYKYTVTKQPFAINKPGWDALIGLKYNLKNKVIAGLDLNALGERKVLVTNDILTIPPRTIVIPAHFNLNLSAEYRYSKILSFWVKINNIGFNRYYEWAFYPSQRFMGMVGFTYSL